MIDAVKEVARLKKAIDEVANIYVEKRSDVSDMLQGILNGKEPDAKNAEHRFVKFSYAGKDFLYDTLTTIVEVKEEEHWRVIEGIEYED